MQKRPRILVVDDEEDLRSSVADVLRCLLDVDVEEAASGHAAMAAQRRAPADAAVVDFRMPHMNGLEAVAELRKITPGLRVVLFTAYQDGMLADEARLQGVDCVLGKPSHADELVNAVQALLDPTSASGAIMPGQGH